MNYFITIFSIATILAIAGCGGGGGAAPVSSGGGSSSFSTIPDLTWNSTVNPANIASYKTSEYIAQFGLNEIDAADAYSLLETNGKAIGGDDIKIGISDSGVLDTHKEISANYDAADSTSPTDTEGHGTHVASTAAGVKDGVGMHGVAFNAQIISVNLLGDNTDGSGGGAGIIFAGNAGAKVVNMSWEFVESCSVGDARCVDGQRTMFAENTTNDSNYLSIKSYLSSEFASAVTNDVVMAVAAGNDGDSTHLAMPALFAGDAVTNGQMIAVAAVDKNGNIAFYSNQCKQAKNFCLAAPGGSGFSGDGNNIFAADITTDSSYVEKAGTSMATPHVAGAAAVLLAAWPYLSASQTVQILLETATDLGVAGVDDVYGHGLLNLGNAVTAQGPNNIAPLNLVTSLGFDARTSSISTNPIFGNAYSKNLAPILKDAVFFDKYGRDYKANLDQKITSNNSNSYNLDNLLFTNYSSAALPVSFGENYSNNLMVKFNTSNVFSDPISGETRHNKFGLKHLTIDRSKEDQSGFNSSNVAFSYSKNFSSNLKVGFNKNDFSSDFSWDNPAQNYHLISYNNFASSPYKKLSLANFTSDGESQINSNQLNIAQNITPNLTTNLSYTSYNQSNSINKFSSDESRIFETGLSYKLNNKTKFGFNFGNLKELNNNFLGSNAQGAFSGGSNPQTKYVALNFTRNLVDNWQLTTSYSQGKTNVSGNSLGVFRDFNDIQSRGLAVGLLNNSFFNGRFGVVYSEPLRVYKGTTNIDIPISRDLEGNVQRLTANNVSLVPDGKEKDLEFSYSFNLKESDA
jgi:hypothetical protein